MAFRATPRLCSSRTRSSRIGIARLTAPFDPTSQSPAATASLCVYDELRDQEPGVKARKLAPRFSRALRSLYALAFRAEIENSRLTAALDPTSPTPTAAASLCIYDELRDQESGVKARKLAPLAFLGLFVLYARV